ncbi:MULTISPECIES: UDP-N-acetylglucosamine 2-epimerase (non-hydrolyzing) [unclassified Pseudodesulfovibrio]|uniref:non-hydrolyzing UDP-N-acetylglucosamine 2-epimerase n=1 Tax=unclassified Pseudodesulfovibrio TaxID=2661612 RepID=UPI000FEC0A8F|nr:MULTISPECIES: UDP-N-acetylglucosamine 2-epimerase (non-hydrolyzing) [unclassified Pseudodesulfovibrio]MCJ2165640.1 UDP-N-acetylglucosamine 2-epimerase (non-hydrolyzing) [Pseudodesulfovibrio sp. S3-i]RWU03047.1 UDP-N-acetylglucosamine 2-epimerase (non-hydrolyzing) [Pseudodesulfovibrio sp. S3]
MDRLTLVTIVGARPQFVKAATVSRAVNAHNRTGDGPELVEYLVHTGQHYDHAMSQTFFDELNIARPDENLGVGSGPHGAQTARMLEALESVLTRNSHDAVLVYGDTNSTLAGALAAAKLHTPVFHVEAGLRSFNKAIPEEVNRILTDHVSSLLLCPTQTAVDNLRRESITQGVHLVGDVMYDSVVHYRTQADGKTDPPDFQGLTAGGYLLATVHRAENTDHREKLEAILSALGEMGRTTPVILALHPRTRKLAQAHGLSIPETVQVVEPLPYLSMLRLQANALGIVTDSGGIQKEAFFLGKPCLTVREETEWLETVEFGANTLAGTDREIMRGWHNAVRQGAFHMPEDVHPYGDGNAAGRIVETILDHFSHRT